MKFTLLSIVSAARNVRCIALWLALAALYGCNANEERELLISGPTMGTGYNIRVVTQTLDGDSLKQLVDARLLELNRIFSTYMPDSELSRLNRKAGEGPILISAELARVLETSREIYAASNGAFDVTIGPLVNLWGFGPGGVPGVIPDRQNLARAMTRVGFHKVKLDGNRLTRPAGLYIDLSAVAKGYAVDDIAALLEKEGANRYMVEIGGEVRASGLNRRGRDWKIGIETPEPEARRLHRTLPVRNLALATSGDYRNFFELDGRVYSHTIDPASGWPVNHQLASVTVLHPSAAMADGLATAFSVLGPEKAMAEAEAKNLPILVIMRVTGDGQFEDLLSSAMNTYLREVGK